MYSGNNLLYFFSANHAAERNRGVADAEGDREANQLKSEANALAKQLGAAIHRVGVDGAMQLKMAELQGELIKAGVIPQAVLGQDSIFGQPFYSLKRGEKIKTPLRALKGGKVGEE